MLVWWLNSAGMGFVLVHENLKQGEFVNAIRVFGEMRSNYDVGFVYYAGCGMQVNAENYLLPTKESFEPEYDVIDFGISAQSILRYRNFTRLANVLILDAAGTTGSSTSQLFARFKPRRWFAEISPQRGHWSPIQQR